MIKSIRSTKIGDFDIQEFNVGDCIDQIEKFGNQFVLFKDGKNTKYIKQVNNLPGLTSAEPKPSELEYYPQYRNIVSWPMAGIAADSTDLNKPLVWYEKKDKKKEKPIFIDGVESKEKTGTINLTTFLEKKGIDPKDQIIRPQVVYLGLNCSGKQEGEGGFYTKKQRHLFQWSNGFGDMANIVRNSPISGGYFTDFIKCYKETKSVDVQCDNISFDVYLKIFEQELDDLRKIFLGEESERKDWPIYIIICGLGTANTIRNPKTYKTKSECYELAECLKAHGYIVQVKYFGLHYGKSGNQFADHFFENDLDLKKSEDFKNLKKKIKADEIITFDEFAKVKNNVVSQAFRLSCGRIYNSIDDLEADKDNDRKRYAFAIKIKKDGSVYLEDKTKSSTTKN